MLNIEPIALAGCIVRYGLHVQDGVACGRVPGTGRLETAAAAVAAAAAAAAAATVAAAKAVARAAKVKAATAMANAAAAVGIRILSRNRLTVAGTDVGRKEVTVGVKGTAATMDRDAV